MCLNCTYTLSTPPNPRHIYTLCVQVSSLPLTHRIDKGIAGFADVHPVTFFADSDEMIKIVNIFDGYCTSVLALLCHKAEKQTFTNLLGKSLSTHGCVPCSVAQ